LYFQINWLLTFKPLKKLLYVLLVAAAAFSSCKKDTSTLVDITHNDLSQINSQLAGTWVFPVSVAGVVDTAGKPLTSMDQQQAPAFSFDGGSKLSIMPDTKTVTKATYKLATNKGLIYINIDNADGTTTQYQVVSMTNQTLKLTSSQPTTFYEGGAPVTAKAVVNTVLTRQSSADVTGSMISIIANSDSTFNIGVYVKHKNATPDTAVLLTQQSNVKGPYNFAFSAKKGDHLSLDIFGSSATTFNAYYKGIPLNGEVQLLGGEIKTDTGWDIP